MTRFIEFSNAGLTVGPQAVEFGVELGEREPVFDIKVTSQKSSPFSTVAQNERAMELFKSGFFNPQLSDQALATLEMMDFEGIEKVRQHVEKNGTLLKRSEQLQQQVMQLATIVDAKSGTTIAQGIAGQMMQAKKQQPGPSGTKAQRVGQVETNSLGSPIGKAQGSPEGVLAKAGKDPVAKARVQAAQASLPRV